MTHTLQIREVKRWWEFNEFEGEVHGELDGVPVGMPVELWDAFRPGVTLEVEAWVERQYGGVEILLPDSPAKLEQTGDGVVHDIVGAVVAQDGDELRVDSVLPLRVDLEWAERFGEPPPLRIGEVIRVRGALKVELVEQPGELQGPRRADPTSLQRRQGSCSTSTPAAAAPP